ncbi:PrgH/EprH family type III secretion apparatus protein [Erwinia amylovora]|uniref:PrgH/EprH family type III secretion apparatus protein n=1 Tax=Erwinia amylovora TaxID=552 RepID=UPI000C075FA8|nr:PrgH/EprH family type III secretion apparatus protein [Erwinia amylovora]MBZ2400159.1 PrgH/EprH family type III secretion apparatus protein [Erwinia amylovora]MBZ2403593.1 PrgH/EprH family type III secretion apparatus protein [Erwinia amylovora]
MNTKLEEMSSTAITDSRQPNYTLKILFGPMFGCELHLPADDYFLIINPAYALHDKTAPLESSHEHAAHYTRNTLYVPGDAESPNVTLFLSGYADNDGVSGFRTEINDESGSYESTIYENQVFTLGPVHFALKRCADEWSDEIRQFNQSTASNIEHTDKQFAGSDKKKKILTIFLTTTLLLVLLVLASLIGLNKFESKQRVLTLSEALAGSPSPLYIVKARDNQNIYVLAHHFQEMEWAKEALLKLKENPDVIPLWLKEQKLTVVTQLQHSGYPVLQIDYGSPQHPVLAVYRQLTTAEVAGLKAAALRHIPFALDVSVKVRTKNQLLQEARQGLDRLHIPYRQIATSTGYGLITRDALNDSALSNLKYFIQEFNHQWGNSIISFSINLDDNWLQDKSYVDSSDGYLFMNPRHWYFPIKKGSL